MWALKKGIYVIQDRSFISSLAYQPEQAKFFENQELTIEQLLELPGNKLAYENAPGLILVPNVPVEVAMERLKGREKDDVCIFENKEFQDGVRSFYFSGDSISDKIRGLFPDSTIVSIDTSKDEDKTKASTIKAIIEYRRKN